MNCLVVDDEKLAVELVEDNIRNIPFLVHIGSCRNALEALKAVNEKQVDLIFLDIKMPGINGLEFIQSLEKPPLIILTTAFENYALEAFKLNVVDYLLKPYTFARFVNAVGKAHDLFTLRQKVAVPEIPPAENHFFVNASYSLVKIRLSDIAFIEGLKDYVKIHLVNEKPVITRINLKDLSERLPESEFMRVHRSFIISLDKIESVQKYQIVIAKNEIPVGESYRQALFNYIDQHNF